MNTATQIDSPRQPKLGLPADDRFDDFAAIAGARFIIAMTNGPIFTTSVPLFDRYLDAAPQGERQVRNCHCCRRFFDHVGGLVTVDAEGVTHSALWSPSARGFAPVPPMYADAAKALEVSLRNAPIAGVFVTSQRVIGIPATPPWTHFAVDIPADRVWTLKVKAAHEVAAEKREDRRMIERALSEFPIDVVRKALALLTSGQLFRSEKCIGVAKWLVELHEARAATKDARRIDALTWRAIATAPVGYAHVRGGMIGTLLEDVVAGLAFADVKRKFDSKMDPLAYMRPQAAPTTGNIAAAEKLVEKLGIARSIERRFAKLADVQTLWTPAPPKTIASAPSAVFGHLLPKSPSEPVDLGTPPAVTTWVKFLATVLPTADAIDFFVPRGPIGYFAMVTAAHADAPPILQWDLPEKRNHVSWYTHSQGSFPSAWNLRAGDWHPVTALVEQPSSWARDGRFTHHGESVMFALKGARDVSHTTSGGLFPEQLKSELHEVRATIEAHAKNATIAGRDEAEVCGPRITKGRPGDLLVRVTSKGQRVQYKIDRWD